VSRRADSTSGALAGSYRFRVRIPTDAAGSEEVVETSVFVVQ